MGATDSMACRYNAPPGRGVRSYSLVGAVDGAVLRRLSRASLTSALAAPLSPPSARSNSSRKRRLEVALLNAWRGYCRDGVSEVSLDEDMARRYAERAISTQAVRLRPVVGAVRQSCTTWSATHGWRPMARIASVWRRCRSE
jgi:hypothetical protein